jgi:hypothetical protein
MVTQPLCALTGMGKYVVKTATTTAIAIDRKIFTPCHTSAAFCVFPGRLLNAFSEALVQDFGGPNRLLNYSNSTTAFRKKSNGKCAVF